MKNLVRKEADADQMSFNGLFSTSVYESMTGIVWSVRRGPEGLVYRKEEDGDRRWGMKMTGVGGLG